ncbi:dual specificity protein phosphatase [Nocardioides sp. CFH 31398]|uniref:dual specificity protein phosphatase family protein n=1 Tax=Nocardioides sp. CFH 31398 TaxID=2919579 RepID=UPI001F06D462|nr:dual specificity protein phosphatase [Nocardioides sp. CFH 31398]MCH1866583.1 dual specificity protein phosphatase family protein [Nocardioides sp. CFH 31398]
MSEGPNADRVLDRLWIGGDLPVEDEGMARGQLDALYDAGVRQIVDCRIEWDDSSWVLAEHPDLDYRWLGVDDAGQTMPDEWFETGTDAVLEHLEGGGTSLVHCHMGINRGPSMGFAVMLRLGWDPVEALERIVERRPVAYVDYAEDAVDWWRRREGAEERVRAEAVARVRRWRDERGVTMGELVRRTRSTPPGS